MFVRVRSSRWLLLLVLSTAAVGQHCGGPCEVRQLLGSVSPNPRYTLSDGVEKANGRWLDNWYWTEHGQQKHSLERALREPPLVDFARRRVFVSPAGNGFLVTGNPDARARRLDGREPPLFVYCDPEGNRLVEVPLRRALTDEELRLDRCPVCECCTDLLYVFAEDASLSSNGCFVALRTYNTNRSIDFFLPLGLLVLDRPAFEAALERGDWASLPPLQAERERKEIQALLGELGAEDRGTHERAAQALITKGFLALATIRTAWAESRSGDFRARAKAVEGKLRPVAGAEWEALPIDLGLLGALLAYSDEDVVRAVQARLARILPASRTMDPMACAQWIVQHRAGLKWNAAKGQYEP